MYNDSMANTKLDVAVGTRFGHLTTTSSTYQLGTSRRVTYVDVACDCGQARRVRLDTLRRGTTKGCGCQRGKSRASEYQAPTPGDQTFCARALCRKLLGEMSHTPKRTDSVVYGYWFCDSTCARAEANVRKAQARRDQGLDVRITKNRRLMQLCGITLEEWEAQLEDQDNRCALCHKDLGDLWDDKHTDHDHGSGCFRGILCTRCNTALGLLDDDPERMMDAAEYVRNRGVRGRKPLNR